MLSSGHGHVTKAKYLFHAGKNMPDRFARWRALLLAELTGSKAKAYQIGLGSVTTTRLQRGEGLPEIVPPEPLFLEETEFLSPFSDPAAK